MKRIKRTMLIITAAALTVAGAAAAGAQQEPAYGNPVVGPPPQPVEDEYLENPAGYRVESWVEDLEIPWELVFLSPDRALVTERPGRIRLIENGRLRGDPYLDLTGEVAHRGEGGLMGLAVHPDFPDTPYLYVMYTYYGGGLANGVARIRHRGNYGELDGFILADIPGGSIHDGGRIHFGPDGYLYITTGEVGNPELAQDQESLAGKFLRIAPDGSIPKDNPFPGSPVYSLGHRNPQGFTWHPSTGEIFASEHGPSGEFGLRGRDNFNVIRAGENYGWPLVLGDADVEGYTDPVVMWVPATPPAGVAFHGDYFYVATLGSEALVRIRFERDRRADSGYRAEEIVRLFATDGYSGTYGRLRQVVVGPDDALYVLTSNRDGRGRPRPGDDKILRIVP
jgi:glucose/arabinose dehydrogenase